jgi:tetratricopeptide (TPR) repeat protein
MSRTPRKPDDDQAVPIVVEPAVDASIALDMPIVLDAAETSPDSDGERFARDAQAASDAGEGRRVDALICTQALLAERAGDTVRALSLWRSGFDRDPTLLVAYWGLRRALVRLGAWDELLGVVGRRIAAVFSPERADTRADLWLVQGRIAEDRLGRDDEAARCYRSGLIEVPEHDGLLTALLLLGFRTADAPTIVDALSGYLRSPLPPRLRASITAWQVRIERSGTAVRTPPPASRADAPLDPDVGRRSLETLRAALQEVDVADAAPLLDGLSQLARAVADPAVRAEILGALVSHIADGANGLAVALLRERARLLRDDLGDVVGAATALTDALQRDAGHPLVIAELADLIDAGIAGNDPTQADRAATQFRELLEQIAPGDRPYATDAEQDLALRYLTAVARARRHADGLALLDRHPELDRARADVFALQLIFRATLGDVAGLATTFAALVPTDLAGGGDASTEIGAAHNLVVAGTLRALIPDAAPARADGSYATSLQLFRRAAALAPAYEPAAAAVERTLFAAGRWSELAAHWQAQLTRERAATEPGAVVRETEERLLEELVAVFRDRLNDPATARRYQEELVALTNGDLRARVRLHDLDLTAGSSSDAVIAAEQVRGLCALADRARVPAIAAALRIDAARVAGRIGDVAQADALFKQSVDGDTTGAAWAGIEAMSADPDAQVNATARAAIVRSEIAALIAGSATDENVTRVRAIRFREGWHALSAARPAEAVAALEPLRAVGDAAAQAWSWEIARRSGDAKLAVAVLRQSSKVVASGGLETAVDLGESLERAGDLTGAAVAYREAHSKEPSADAALGLLRVGAVLGNSTLVLEAARGLASVANAATAPALAQEVTMLSLVQGIPAVTDSTAAAPADVGDDPMAVVLRWAAGVRSGDVLGASAGLLAFARALPAGGSSEMVVDKNGLLARAAARARLGGSTLAGAVHDQVQTLSSGTAPIGVGLADLPVAGRPDRIAARIARAARNAAPLACILDIERALDAEARGNVAGALDGFAQALGRDSDNIEALDGIKRLAQATGDRLGAARAGMRLGTVLRVPGRAAAEFGMAAQIYEDLNLHAEAVVGYWQALQRDPRSDWLYERLRQRLMEGHDHAAMDRLYGHRLAILSDPQARADLLVERAQHRLDRMDDRRGAIDDFKRILNIDSNHQIALRQLATLATQMEYFPQGVRFLDRLLGLEVDEERAACLRLELADAYEASRDVIRAIEVLRRAVSARPHDRAPWQKLTDLQLRMGDWPNALATLRSWEVVLADAVPKAEIWIRIGNLQRDHGRDTVAAAAAFATAAELDPLGDGIFELVRLHERLGAADARLDALARAIAGVGSALAADPLDVALLRRLKDLHQLAATGADGAGAADHAAGIVVTGQLLALAGEDVDLPSLPRTEPRALSGAFWSRVRLPGAGGFAAEIWPLLGTAAGELFPAQTRLPPRERVTPGAEPRLAWVEGVATAVGLPMLEIALPKAATADAGDATVTAIEGGHLGLFVGRGVLAGDAPARFRVGRALSLLRDRAVVFDRISAAELESLLTASAVVAGASVPVVAGTAKSVEERARSLGRAMSRKDRKSLELAASRFGFESVDAAVFRESILATADRLGLMLAGDIATAVRIAGSFGDDPETKISGVEIASNKRASDLIRFALSEDYLSLRRTGGGGEG